MAAVRLCLSVVLLLLLAVVDAQTATSTSTAPETTSPATSTATTPQTSPSSTDTTPQTPPSTSPTTEPVTTSVPTVRPTTEAPCPVIGTIRKNNWPETETGYMTSTPNATGVTNVGWAPYDPSSDYIDASLYVAVVFNQTSQTIDFTALPSMAGVRDYPATTAQLGGTCRMTCGSDTGEFDFFTTVTDQNTATPIFDSAPYSVDVIETLPTGFIIPDLVISASDYDADQGNYEISFSLQGGSPFSLTGTVKTSDAPPTYNAQLKLSEPLDYTAKPSYTLTVTAEDPGGLSSEATITVNVIDTDTRQPEFEKPVYTVTVEDPETPGPLFVDIKAVDEDAPGNVTYELLTDTTGGQYANYFSLDSVTAQLSLTKDLTDILQPYNTTATFPLEAKEDGGNHFTCRSVLSINLPALAAPTTTTEPPTTTTPMTSTEPSSSTTTDASTTSETPSTSPGTPTTSPGTPSTTPGTPTTSPGTPTTSPGTPSTTPGTPSTSPGTPTTSPGTPTTSPGTPSTTPGTPTTSPGTPTTPGTPSTTPGTPTSTPISTPTPTPTLTPISTPTATPTPTPTPMPCLLFDQRQYLADKPESFTGEVITVSAAPEAGDVTYFLRTPGYEDSFALDESTGTLTKKKKLSYQRVSLLVQAIPDGGSKKDQTNDTDIVDWDETLIIVDITDENDSPPVLNCAAYASSCDSVAVGFPASKTATLPAPLLRLTVTDDDTGAFGVDGIKYGVDSSALEIDSSGMLYLIKQQDAAFTATVTATDDNGGSSGKSDTAKITLVPVSDDQVFFVRTENQLTNAADVTSLLQNIADSGQYRAVFSLDFQALSATDTAPSLLHVSDDDGGSTIYIYALREDGSAIVAVDSGDIEDSLDDVKEVEYIQTKDDQMSGGGGDEGSDTGLIVAVAVLACLLVAVIVAAVLRQRQLLQRSASTYTRQKNDAESYSGAAAVTNANYSPSGSRRGSVVPPGAVSYTNRAFQPAEKPVSSELVSGSDSLSRSDQYQVRDEEPYVTATTPRPATPPAAATATLIEIDDPPPAQPEPEPEPEEPTPDYSLKSVGFRETVICVSPPLEPHEEEEEEEEEEEQGEDGGKAEGVHDPTEHASGQDDKRKTSDDGSENGENSML